MKKIVFYIFCFVAFFSINIFAATVLPKGLGLGIIVGDPTGFTGKYFFSRKRAFDFAFGYDLDSHIHFHGDYVFHFPSFLPIEKKEFERLSAYIPIGGKIYYHEIDNDNNNRNNRSEDDELILSIRFGAGILYNFLTIPLETFLEIVPTMDFLSETNFYIDFALGVRYYF